MLNSLMDLTAAGGSVGIPGLYVTGDPGAADVAAQKGSLSLSLGIAPLVVGLTTSIDRLIQVRRNRLLSLNQAPETDYVDQEAVTREVAFARRIFADNGWPVIDVTRRSIEESAAAIINLCNERRQCA